jgi:Holliday junction DNA helicase RuvA
VISRISGVLVSVSDDACEIAPGAERASDGLTYTVMLPAYMAARLEGKSGTRVTLFTRYVLEGVGQGTSFVPRLMGFGSVDDRALFELLTTVKGLGGRRALRAMAIEPMELARAIAEGDTGALVKLPEIGKKLAESIVHELAGKVPGVLLGEAMVEGKAGGGARNGVLGATASLGVNGVRLKRAGRDAVAALMALGETSAEAERRVSLVVRESPDLDSADGAGANAIVARALGG